MEPSRKEYYESYGKRNILRELPPDAPLLFHEKLRKQRLIGFLPEKAGLYALDCGCGDGSLSQLAATRGARVVSLDLSVERLKKNIPAAAARGIIQTAGDCCALPYKNGSFDAVIVSELLEHVPEDDAMLREVARVLKPGSFFILSVPYKEMINTVVCPNCRHEFFRHGHLRSYDRASLKSQLSRCGFRVRQMRLSNNLKTRYIRGRRFWPLSWIARLDALFSRLFPEQSKFLIAVCEKP